MVYSGVALAYGDGSEEVFSEETRVEFGDYPDRIIKQYVDSGEPLWVFSYLISLLEQTYSRLG